MSRTKRVVIAFTAVELLLAGLWFWIGLQLSNLASHPAGVEGHAIAVQEKLQEIGSTVGMVMGAVAGFFVLLFVIVAKADRETPKP